MKKKNQKNGKNSHSVSSSSNGAEPKHRRTELHPTRIDIDEKNRKHLCEILNQTLGATFDLYSQTKQAHWNVKGVHFYQLHLLFDEIAGELIEYVDMFAERVTALGGTALGTVRMASEGSFLPEFPTNIDEGMEFVVALADRLAMYGEMLREHIDISDDLGDKDTADLYTEVSRDIDKRLWFLDAHLQAPSAEREATKGLLVMPGRRK